MFRKISLGGFDRNSSLEVLGREWHLPIIDLRENHENFSELLLLARAEEKKRVRMITLVVVVSESRKGPVTKAKEFRLGPRAVDQNILGFSFSRGLESGYYEYSRREESMVPSSRSVNLVVIRDGTGHVLTAPLLGSAQVAERLYMNEVRPDDIRLLLASLPAE